MLVGSDEIFYFNIVFSVFYSLSQFFNKQKDNMGSSCVACTMFDMRLVDGTLEHDLCYPGNEGLPAVSMCYVWPLLVICRVAARQSQAFHSLLWDGVSSSG